MTQLRQIYCIGWAFVLGMLIVGGYQNGHSFLEIATQSRRFIHAAIVLWIIYSIPFGITFLIVRMVGANQNKVT